MATAYTQDELRSLFQSSFNLKQWYSFLQHFFNARVLAALSGGADSVALVCVLRALGYPVRAYHLNHCLRGEESERDADFVHSLCIKLDVPLTLEREDA